MPDQTARIQELQDSLDIAIDALQQCPTVEAIKALIAMEIRPNKALIMDFISATIDVIDQDGASPLMLEKSLSCLGLTRYMDLSHWLEVADLTGRSNIWAIDQHNQHGASNGMSAETAPESAETSVD